MKGALHVNALELFAGALSWVDGYYAGDDADRVRFRQVSDGIRHRISWTVLRAFALNFVYYFWLGAV